MQVSHNSFAKTIIIRDGRKKWELPRKVRFEGVGLNQFNHWPSLEYEVLGYREPKAGEHYLSGARGFIRGYKAPNDLGTSYLVVKPKLDTDG